MTVSTALAIWFAATIAIAALARSRTGARVGVCLVALMLLLPALVVTHDPLARGFLAFTIAALLARAIDFAFGPSPTGFGARLLYSFAFLSFIDTQATSPRPRGMDWRAAGKIILAASAIATAVALWSAWATFPGWIRYLARSLTAAVVITAFAEIQTSLVQMVTALLGISLPPVHDAPYRSRTVNEFWSRRWNLTTAQWLSRHCFRPLARQGVTLALVGTFVASAALHAYLLIAEDAWSALLWASFFLAQPLLILVERKLRVRHWPPAAGSVWTVTSLVLLLPLLVNPVLPLFKTTL